MHPSLQPPRPARRGLLKRLYTSNPFYVISADLVFIGLRMSFDTSGRTFETGALMIALLGYTLLLATTACVLIRLGEVWDDVRTILLLVVAMFLAISVTFDETLARNPRLGTCFLRRRAWRSRSSVSEGMLRGVRLRLPAGFRIPYYLILAVVLPLPGRPDPAAAPTPRTLGCNGCCSASRPPRPFAFATLIPAIRRGPATSPTTAAPGDTRSIPGSCSACSRWPSAAGRITSASRSTSWAESDNIFGPYFLVPFALVLDVLLLEAGLVSRNGKIQQAAILVLPAIVALAALRRTDPTRSTRGSSRFSSAACTASPLDFAIVGSMAFCGYAALPTRPAALVDGLPISLVRAGGRRPGRLGASGRLDAVRPIPLLAASRRWNSTRRPACARSWRAWSARSASIGVVAIGLGPDRLGRGAGRWSRSTSRSRPSWRSASCSTTRSPRF